MKCDKKKKRKHPAKTVRLEQASSIPLPFGIPDQSQLQPNRKQVQEP
jgi:hypothetical protein